MTSKQRKADAARARLGGLRMIMRAYVWRFVTPEGSRITWTRWYYSLARARADARAVLRREFPDGNGGTTVTALTVAEAERGPKAVGSRRGGVAEVTTTPGLVYQREILARIEAQREAKRAARKARKRPSTRTRRR